MTAAGERAGRRSSASSRCCPPCWPCCSALPAIWLDDLPDHQRHGLRRLRHPRPVARADLGLSAASCASARPPSSASAATPTPSPPSISATPPVPVLLAAAGAGRVRRARSATSCSTAGVSDVYLGVITLTVTLILFKLHQLDAPATSGPSATAPLGRLQRHSRPRRPLNWPGDPATSSTPDDIFSRRRRLLADRLLRLQAPPAGDALRPGRSWRSARTRLRAELLGYDVRAATSSAIFAIGGAHRRPRRHPVRQLRCSSARPCSALANQRPDHHLGDRRRRSAR